jgi:hypothetical protein
VPPRGVRCYYVPDHHVPVCLKRPLVTTSLHSLRPLIITFLLKSLIWSLRPLNVMSPVWNVPGSLQFLFIMSLALDHNVPVVTISLICLAICTFILSFCSELHQPMDWLGIQPIHGLVEFCWL